MFRYSLNTNKISSYWHQERAFVQDGGYAMPREQVCKVNQAKLEMSKKAKRRLKNSVNWLCACSAKRKVSLSKKSRPFDFRISFVTLTLPTKQKHSHKEIKSKCLNQFLTVLRQKFGVQNYVWKAELQKNGNVHFHLTFDKFIHYLIIRKYWNSAIAKLGYVSEYANKFANMTESEYIEYRGVSKQKAVEAAKRAYRYGVATNWQSPNSTDVKSVKNVQNLASYLSKYLAKPLASDESNEVMQESAESWKGRTWFCSQSLSRLKNVTIRPDKISKSVFDWFRNSKSVLALQFDYCEVVYFKLKRLPKWVVEWLRQNLLSHAIACNYPFPAAIPNW